MEKKPSEEIMEILTERLSKSHDSSKITDEGIGAIIDYLDKKYEESKDEVVEDTIGDALAYRTALDEPEGVPEGKSSVKV